MKWFDMLPTEAQNKVIRIQWILFGIVMLSVSFAAGMLWQMWHG